jgi:putative membrane protein
VKRLLLSVVVNGLALWIASLLVSGVRFGKAADLPGTVTTIALVAIVFGLIDWAAGLVRVIAAPLTLVSFGFFALVINALVLLAVSNASASLGLAFHVDTFWWDAVWGALVVTIASMVLRAVLPTPRNRERS